MWTQGSASIRSPRIGFLGLLKVIMKNRELKFRAWDKTNKEMYAVNAIDFKNKEFLELENERAISSSVIPIKQFDEHFVLMQYTGLKDKNGVEIYEGDICKFNGGAEDFYAEVGFDYGCYIVKMPWIADAESYPELKYYIELSFVDCTVIGNIYENAELLENSNTT
jgi:uncharacterized phage protein (TIGR01671 family)